MSVGAGWTPIATPGVRQPTQTFPAGDLRTSSVSLSGNFAGYTAEWRLGLPAGAEQLGFTSLGPAVVEVFKIGAAQISLSSSTPGSWLVSWTIAGEDTKNVPPGIYWQQVRILDPNGEPTTVAEGYVVLTPSLASVGP